MKKYTSGLLEAYLKTKQHDKEFGIAKKRILGYKNITENRKKKIQDIFNLLEENQNFIFSEIDYYVTCWWDNLPGIWKYIFLFNIDFSPKVKDFDKFNPHYSFSRNYNSILNGLYFIKPSNYNVLEVVEQLWDLKYFYIDVESMHKIESLKPLSYLKNITKLAIKENKCDLLPLSNLVKLKKLDLSYNMLDLEPISKLNNLEELNLSSNKADIKPIANLTRLTHLNLFYNEFNLEPISNLKNLKNLGLWGNKAELDPIANLEKLERLDLNNCYHVSIVPIVKLRNLKTLILSFVYSDLHPITKLTNLTRLEMSLSDKRQLVGIEKYIEKMRAKGCEIDIS